MTEPKPKTGTCGHPALYTWHYTSYKRVEVCLYCQSAQIERLREVHQQANWLVENVSLRDHSSERKAVWDDVNRMYKDAVAALKETT